MVSMKEIGENIRRIRKKKSIPTKAIAQELCVTSNTFSSWERGAHSINAEDVVKICEILGCRSSDILGI